MSEPSKKDLRDIFQRAYLARSEQGDPEATFVSDCSDAGYRALYNAGKADAEARVAELETQLAAIRSELSALRPLSEAGTQGEWYECNGYADGCCDLHSEATGRSLLMWNEEIGPRINVRADAEFIAAAVNAVRRMLAREGGAR